MPLDLTVFTCDRVNVFLLLETNQIWLSPCLRHLLGHSLHSCTWYATLAGITATASQLVCLFQTLPPLLIFHAAAHTGDSAKPSSRSCHSFAQNALVASSHSEQRPKPFLQTARPWTIRPHFSLCLPHPTTTLWASLLPKHQQYSCPRVFTLAVPSGWSPLTPETCMTHSLTSLIFTKASSSQWGLPLWLKLNLPTFKILLYFNLIFIFNVAQSIMKHTVDCVFILSPPLLSYKLYEDGDFCLCCSLMYLSYQEQWVLSSVCSITVCGINALSHLIFMTTRRGRSCHLS